MPASLFQTKPRGLLRDLLRAPIFLFERDLGWLLGHRFLMLTHRGRKTGLPRRTVLEVLRYDRKTGEAVVAAGWGHRSDWYRNIQASPPLEVRIGRRRYVPAHHVLASEEAYAFYTRWEWDHPIEARLSPRLLGIKDYDGSEAARRKLLAMVPLVAFRPAE